MKETLLTMIALLSIPFAYSQTDIKEVSKSDSIRFEKIIKESTDSLKQVLTSKEYLNEAEKKVSIEFASDTLTISKRFELYVAQDYSDYGMKTASLKMLEAYEKLLNKYYRMLLVALNPEDREILKVTQRNWIKYRESEKQMNELISKDNYSGGGSIQVLFVLSREIEMTQNRVIEFYNYIERLNINKE
ncbi:lysozyme inhibitor LprI family protein [Fluviicola sp.]|uniref:lysozyme inhibitor LprI family protein n=1 Tax=Fluviicola sp. TaxID=1917219 RepID=UPI0031E180E3